MRFFGVLLALVFGLFAGMGSRAATPDSWTTLASMETSRTGHSATLLTNGQVLVVGGLSNTEVTTAELYDPASNRWRTVSRNLPLSYMHTATLLRNGKVLVLGGVEEDVSVRLFDPVTESWSQEAGMHVSRFAHTATLLSSGKVLVTGGLDLQGGVLKTAEIYDPATRAWSLVAAPMAEGRVLHTATLLANGKVLVAGGNHDEGALASAELFDPVTLTWSSAGSMNHGHFHHMATLLQNGKVLVAGGLDDNFGSIGSAEVYDPATGAWHSAANMNVARVSASMTLLPNGQVMVAGGVQEAYEQRRSVELYDPATGAWTFGQPMAEERNEFTATLLPNGTVLVVGGNAPEMVEITRAGAAGEVQSSGSDDDFGLAGVEAYQPAAVPVWTQVSPMKEARSFHAATLLSDGRTLLVGGFGGMGILTEARIFNSLTNSWSSGGVMNEPRSTPSATLLPSGKGLVAGGVSNGSPVANVESYDPDSAGNGWTPVPSMTSPRSFHGATLLPNGQVLCTGGMDGQGRDLKSVELYDPVADTWTVMAPMISERMLHKAVLLADGRVLVAGGYSNGGRIADSEVYDPASNIWVTVQAMHLPRSDFAASLLSNGKVLVAGGVGSQGFLSAVEVFDPDTNTWTVASSMSEARYVPQMVVLPNGEILVMGGQNIDGALSSAELYDPHADRWTIVGSMSAKRRFFTATPLPDGRVLAAGGSEAGTVAEVFNPDTRTLSTPQLAQPADPALRPGQPLSLSGSSFHVATDSGNSSYSNSASNLPVLQLRRLDNGAVTFLASTEFSPGSLQSAPLPAEPMAQGWYAATVFVNGTASNSVILRAPRVPDEPSLTDATAQNGGIQVTWSASADDGGAPVTSYVVTAYDHANPAVALGTGCTVSAADLAGGCRITGLSNSIAYVIHVQAVNQVGAGMPAISIPVIPLAVTSAPNSVNAAPGDGQITVSWAAPTDGNGSPIAGYTVNAYVDGQPGTSVGQCTVASSATQCTVTNLTNGTNYLFSVTAHSSDGDSTAAFSVSAVAPVLSVSILASAALPNGRVGEAYSTTIMLVGGSGSYWLSQPPGSLPEGLSISLNDAGTGFIISGTPSKTQTVRFTLTISDNTVGWQTRQKSGPTVRTVTQEFSLTVLAAAGAAPAVATPVPTLNQWGILGLTAIFAVFAMTGARRVVRKGALQAG